MKKRTKVILISIPLIILLLLFAAYQILFNSIDEESRKAIEQQVNRLTTSVLDDVKTDVEKGLSDSGEERQGEEPDSQGGSRDEQEPSAQAEGSPSGSGPSKAMNPEKWAGASQKEKVTMDAYYKAAQKLETEGNQIVNNLLAAAKADYKALKDRGGGKSEMVSLATSYTNRAKVLENQMDGSVNSVIAQMKADLKAAGASQSDVDSYVSSFRSQYNQKKEARRSAVLGKVQELM